MAYSLFLGTITFILAVIWGAPLIGLLKKYGLGKKIRIDGPDSHQVKMGTPTMGGLMIIVPVFLITVVANFVEIVSTTAAGDALLDRLGVARQAFFGESLLVPLGIMIAFAALGAVDDWAGVRGHRRGEGLRGRWQFLSQLIIATVTALVLHFGPPQLHSLALPGLAEKIDINGLWIPIAVFIILATSNGTPAIAAAAPKAERLIICSIPNVGAVAAEVSGEEEIVVVCSGSNGRIAGEDLLCAGLLLEALEPGVDPSSLEDSASLAMLLADRHGEEIEDYMRSTERGRELIRLGYEKDISYCARRDAFTRVPELVQGLIEP